MDSKMAGLAQKARAKMLIAGAIQIRQRFDGDAAAEGDVFSKIDHAHAALAELFDDSIMGDSLANHTERKNWR